MWRRKRIKEVFGWIKTAAGLARTKFRGRERVGWAFAFAAVAYNLTRLPKLLAATCAARKGRTYDRTRPSRQKRPKKPLQAGAVHI
jgi:Transposase DDE domain